MRNYYDEITSLLLDERFPEITKSSEAFDHFGQGLNMFFGQFCTAADDAEFERILESVRQVRSYFLAEAAKPGRAPSTPRLRIVS